MDDAKELQRQFRETVVAWSLARSDQSIANPLFDRQHQLARRLGATNEGRELIESLLDDDEVTVRAAAGTESLAWKSAKGLDTLCEIAERSDLLGFEAGVTVKEFRAGS